jgi:hypothetical protein
MPLHPPQGVGLLSQCSTDIRIHGRLTASTVQVQADNALAAQDIASRLHQIPRWTGGLTLSAFDRVSTKQASGMPRACHTLLPHCGCSPSRPLPKEMGNEGLQQ